jgi:putative acetyltransferase
MKQIKQVREEGIDLNIIRELFKEYEKELDADLCFQHFEEELANPLKKYGEPSGKLLLAYWNGESAGCIGLTPMDTEGFCEMKRLYVRPEFRKYGIGRNLVEELTGVARRHGYRVMRLDTLKKLRPAIQLYESFGFYHIGAYYHNPLPDVVFMEKKLV